MDADIYVVMKRQPVPPNRILETLFLSLSLFLSRVVDANSYPLVFLEFRTARNLALSLSLGKFLHPSTSFAIGLICPTDDFARIDFAGCQLTPRGSRNGSRNEIERCAGEYFRYQIPR